MLVRLTCMQRIDRKVWLDFLDEERIRHTDYILDAEVFLDRFTMIASSSFKSLG
jgi:hypothetical protein